MQSHPKYKILHVTNSLSRVGGVETLINEWVDADPSTAAIALLDNKKSVQGKHRRWGLRQGKWDSLFRIKNLVKQMELHCKTLILHNFSGLKCMAGLIKYDKIIVYLHTNSNDVLSLVQSCANDVDGYIASSRQLEAICQNIKNLRQVPILYAEHPIGSVYQKTKSKRDEKTCLVIGYAGRLEIEQKRVDRLVDLCTALQKKDVSFRFQIAGAGSYKKTLLKKLDRFPIEYLGPLTTNELKNAYSYWDFNVLTSDYETGPLTILEGMACGSIPLIPKIECQATEKLLAYQQTLFYKPGDMTDAADKIQALSKYSKKELLLLREKLRFLIKNQTLDKFLKKINSFVNSIEKNANRQKLANSSSAIEEHLPFFILSKIQNKKTFLR